MPLDGLRAWIGEVERKLGIRTRVFLVLTAIAIGIGGAAMYLAIDTRESSVSEGDVRALQEELEAQMGTGGGLAQLETELQSLQAQVEQLRGGEEGAPGGQQGGTGGAGGGAQGGAGNGGPGGDGGTGAGQGVGPDSGAGGSSDGLDELLESAREQSEEAEGE